MQERKAVYNREADKKYREANREKVRYTNYKSGARVFLRDMCTLEDLEEFQKIIDDRRAGKK